MIDRPFERLKDSVIGYGLWRKKEPHGGYSYWTDDVGMERRVLDEGLDDPRIIFEVLDRTSCLQQWLDSYYEHKEQYGHD